MMMPCMCFSGLCDFQGTNLKASRLEITQMTRLDVPFYVAVMVALWPVYFMYNERNIYAGYLYSEATTFCTIVE